VYRERVCIFVTWEVWISNIAGLHHIRRGLHLSQRAMPSLAEGYRAKASVCAELAAETKDPYSRRVLGQTAEQWNALADGVEKHDGMNKHDATGK
jgi:hypothetical protein